MTRQKSAIITAKTCVKDLAVITEWFEKQGITFPSAYAFMDTIVVKLTESIMLDDKTLKYKSVAEANAYLQERNIKAQQGSYGKQLLVKALTLENNETSDVKSELDLLMTEEIVKD